MGQSIVYTNCVFNSPQRHVTNLHCWWLLIVQHVHFCCAGSCAGWPVAGAKPVSGSVPGPSTRGIDIQHLAHSLLIQFSISILGGTLWAGTPRIRWCCTHVTAYTNIDLVSVRLPVQYLTAFVLDRLGVLLTLLIQYSFEHCFVLASVLLLAAMLLKKNNLHALCCVLGPGAIFWQSLLW